jgi:hypothetical protein
MNTTIGHCLASRIKWIGIALLTLIEYSSSFSQTSQAGIRVGMQMFGSFNGNGGGPMVGFFKGRHELSASMIWMEFTDQGVLQSYRFNIGSNGQRVVSFLQLSVPYIISKNILAVYERIDSTMVGTFYDGRITGIHFAIGSDIQLWKNLKLTVSGGLGHNWIRYLKYPGASKGYDVSTSNLQFGLTYRIPFRKEAPAEPLEPKTDPDLWLGLQAESPQAVFYAPLATGKAAYYHPYAEARLTPHMRLRASAWVGPQTVIADADTSTRWGVHGFGLAVRLYSLQLRRLHFFHLVGIEVVPRRFSPLHHNNLALANGFSYDIAHRVNLEAGMNLHINTDDYYMSPFFGVAVPISFSPRKRI